MANPEGGEILPFSPMGKPLSRSAAFIFPNPITQEEGLFAE